jgi:A/G-specific adenine glycosylase
MAVAATDPALRPLLDWFAAEGRDLPWRRTRDPWKVLVSEVMLAQTQVPRVIPYFERFIARWPTPAALAGEPLGEVLAAWQGLGYPRRARDLRAAAAIVADEGWPGDLRTLPGVGPYIASAVRCFAFGEPVVPVDVNVRRVLARRFAQGPPAVAPTDGWTVGQALMEVGQRVCTARAPRCLECPLGSGCSGPPQDAPATARRQARYRGSRRQARGLLLARVLAEGEVSLAESCVPRAIAESLVDDGLLTQEGDRLRAP